MVIPELIGWSHDPDDRLGGGGYAQVFRGSQIGVPNQVGAVKVFDDPLYANTFEQEVRMLRALRGCPHTPALLAYGRDASGRLCIVTELAPGQRLDRYIRRNGPLSSTQVVTLLEQVLAVLAFAHQRDILHKDIKASNILMDGDVFTVLDWGVARIRGNGRDETIRAKQDYVAPECYHGRQEFGTDFYSLGWLVIQAVSGVLPYHFDQEKDRDYRVAAHCLERPELSDALEGSLRNLVANWLRKDPLQRLCGYHLPALLAQAETSHTDFWQWLDFRQISHECSYLHRAARSGVPYAQYHLAQSLLQVQRLREARYWLEQAANQCYAKARYRLSGLLAEINPDRSAVLLEQAANAGHAQALHRLGSTLLRSENNPVKVQRGLSFIRQAADSGHGPGNALLAAWLAPSPEQAEEAWLRWQRARDRGQDVNISPVFPRQELRGTQKATSSHHVNHIIAQATPPPTPAEQFLVVPATNPLELDVHAPAWDRLIQECPFAYPSQTYGWLRAFYTHKLAPRERMCCLFVYQGQKLVGVLPLVGGFRAHGLGTADHFYRLPVNEYHTNRMDLLAHSNQAATLEACFRHLSATSPEPPIIRWRKIPATSPIFAAFRDRPDNLGLLFRQSSLEQSIVLPKDFSAFLAKLDGKFRRELFRQERRLTERAKVTYRFRDTSHTVEDNLARFMAVEHSGWKGSRGTSIQDLAGDPPLYLAAARQFAANGWLEWAFLEADDRDIAAQFAVRLNKTLFLWKVGYREEFANCAPSHLLFLRTVEHACAQGDVNVVNFIARRRWLRVWEVEEHPVYNLIVFPTNASSDLLSRLIPAAQAANYTLWDEATPLPQAPSAATRSFRKMHHEQA